MTEAVKKTLAASHRAAIDGIVMLENKNGALPLRNGESAAVFGRSQIDYNAGGTGSGGLVNTEYQTDILSSLEKSDVEVNRTLAAFYRDWVSKNPVSTDGGTCSSRPLSQKEPQIDEELMKKVSAESETAIVVIGRSAGEEHDSVNAPGGFLLTEDETELLKAARGHFKKLIVLLNVPSVIDMGFVGEIGPDAVLYIWQGGQEGGAAAAEALCRASPSGRLTDTIALSYADYPSSEGFDAKDRIYYNEDIFVGYRYFETFCPEKVLYPFGFGLSYTDFEISCRAAVFAEQNISLTVDVKNIGAAPGREIVQIYAEPPKSKMPRPKRSLVEFAKTKTLAPGETQTLRIKFPLSRLKYYDDKNSEQRIDGGEYKLIIGKNIRDKSCSVRMKLSKDIIKKRGRLAAPKEPFRRLIGFDGGPIYEDAPTAQGGKSGAAGGKTKRKAFSGIARPRKYKFEDVKSGGITLDEFVDAVSDKDLACLCRGEGMGSKLVRPGTGAAFGGVSKGLQKLGIPCAAATDGPSGLRFDNGDKAALAPIGTMLACTWDIELIEEIYSCIGGEMIENDIDMLLGPGLNIHRNPLCGRNFEYYSEDPYISGAAAAAALRGLESRGVCGTLKHIAANNREEGRKGLDTVLSERALREIYLRPLEYAMELSEPKAIMTAYNGLNGEMCGSNYELITEIIRGEFGFSGMVMTDWWAFLGPCSASSTKNSAAMLRAGGDIYMVTKNSEKNSGGDNTLKELKSGNLSSDELRRAAKNILKLIINIVIRD